ncbi:MAG TPA: HAD-IIIA family hydrolase, partial [Phaeodactylibacter sp.]|nr:HAD-IIIA family hydrolase [Phaeodactylibacter sp.]
MKKTGWTLFLDRDGVINERLVGTYVMDWKDFRFTYRCLDAIKIFKKYFDTIVVVTNQQCIGKGEMTVEKLNAIHTQMITTIENHGGQIDKAYFCPNLRAENAPCRKPNTGMGWQAKKDFPTINFQQSIMVGDSFSDMEFGWQLGTKTIFIEGKEEENERTARIPVDGRFENLWQFAKYLE